MKEDFDREIDSLLRRRARGTVESRPWGAGAGDGSRGAHLDADELSAFTEGALPAAARVSAASHLADCDRCRGVVVGLARVADSAAEVKPQALAATAQAEPARPSAWGAFFASLFSPRMMRFAVPVLALSLVGVVSYIALRSDNGSLQAVREGRRPNAEPQIAASAPTDETAVANVNANAASLNANAAPRETPPGSVQQGTLKGHGGAESQPTESATAAATGEGATQPATAATPAPAPPPPPPAAAAEGPREVSKAAPKTGDTEEASRGDKEKAETRDNKSARGSEPSDDALANEAQMAQRRVQPRGINEAQTPDGSRNQSQKRAADNNASGGYSGGGNTGTAASPRDADRAGSRSETYARGRAAKRAERKTEEDEDAPAGETRTAAGHRFRREGGAWVDVNYKSNMRSTGVRRGTDAYRALVADVPEVGRVAEAIGGEVIVVVGGRAYRIQ